MPIHQLLVHADDDNILGGSVRTIKNNILGGSVRTIKNTETLIVTGKGLD